MTEESVEIIMLRKNPTLPTAQECSTMNATTSKTSKSNKSSMLVSAFFVMLCLCLLINDSNAAVYKKRSVASTESTTSPIKECHQNTPCGWAIYIPFTSRIDYFMKNTCICNPNLECLKTDDDLSVNAYVYRCKTRPLTTTVVP